MKKVFKLLVTIIIFLTILSGFVFANENQSMETSLISNKNNYQIGEEILINISIDEIKGFSGLNTFLARKIYDEEYLQYIGSEVTNNNWKVLGDVENVLLRKEKGEDIKKGQIVGILKFKAIKAGKTKIQIDNIDACNEEGNVYYEDGNVNSPFIEINISNTQTTQKTYIGIILITIGILGIASVVVHYIINKNKF